MYCPEHKNVRPDLDRPPHLSHQALRISLLLLNRKGYCLIVNEGRESEQIRARSVQTAFGTNPNPLISSQKVSCLEDITFREGRGGQEQKHRWGDPLFFLKADPMKRWCSAALWGMQWHAVFSPQYTAALYNFKTCTLLWMYYKIPTFFLLLALLCDLYCFIPKWLP